MRDSPEVNVLWGTVHGAQKTVTANIYLDMLQLFAFPGEGKEEGGGGKILFLHDGSHSTSAMTYETSQNSDFLIGGLEEANERNGHTKFSPLTTEFFEWRFLKNLFYAEEIRDLRRLRESINISVKAVIPDIF